MLGIRFTKFPPTTYVLHYKNGQVVREGAGLSFFYYAPTSTLVAVPVAGVDLPFVFSEVTRGQERPRTPLRASSTARSRARLQGSTSGIP